MARRTLAFMRLLVRLGTDDADEVLTSQRAADVTEAQAQDDLNLPPLRQDLAALIAELGEGSARNFASAVTSIGCGSSTRSMAPGASVGAI
jgi:hypothetical protein